MATHTVSVREARRNFRRWLEWASGGDEVVLLRYGKPIARLVAPDVPPPPLPDLAVFREKIAVHGRPLSRDLIRERRRARY